MYRISMVLIMSMLGVMAHAEIANVNAGDWDLKFTHEMILVNVDDILTPIEISKPTVEIFHKSRGSFAISDGVMRSVTRTPVANVQANTSNGNPVVSFDYRPTLVISLSGYKANDGNINYLEFEELTNKGEGLDFWQVDDINEVDINDFLISQFMSAGNRHQFKHWAVDWQSARSLNVQVDDLAREVNHFLKNRPVAWDVAIVGHSRGGIFAHQLVRKIVDNSNISQLHVMLLDPTAGVSPWGDQYPSSIPSGKASVHGSLYYDQKTFTGYSTFSIGTIGDQDIQGYNNYNRNDHLYSSSTHTTIVEDWLTEPNRGISRWLTDIMSKKELVVDGFDYDDTAGETYEIVRIQIDNQIYFEGDVTISGDYIEAWGEIGVGPINAGVYSYVGVDGIDAAAYTSIASAAVAINKDQVAISGHAIMSNYGLSLSNNTLNVSTSVVGYENSFSVSKDDVSVSGGVPGVSVSVGTDKANIKIGGHKIKIW